jgi:hypothetical protein
MAGDADEVSQAISDMQTAVLLRLAAKHGWQLSSGEASLMVRSHGLERAVDTIRRREKPVFLRWLSSPLRVFGR